MIIMLALLAGLLAGTYYYARAAGGFPRWAWGALAAFGLAMLLLRRLDFALVAAAIGGVAYFASRAAGAEEEDLLIEFFRDRGGRPSGRILEGQYAGQFLNDLSPSQMDMLKAEMRELHPATYDRLLAELMDEEPSASPPAASSADMSRKEALDILGLSQNASQEEILSAYKGLMRKLHPDQGGTSYLAQKINNAKEALINRDV